MIPSVSAVIVTRGDHDLGPIIDSLPFDDIVIVDNSKRPIDLGVFGRYAGIAEARHDYIYVQDDDAILPEATLRALTDAYDPKTVVANMPEPFRYRYHGHCLVGFGAIFHRDLPRLAFAKWHASREGQRLNPVVFRRTCDIIFTFSCPQRWLDLPYENLPYAEDESRMYQQDGYRDERARVLALARKAQRRKAAAR